MFTLDGAQAQRRSQHFGTLTVGKSAELFVVDQNLFEIPSTYLAKTTMDLTMVNGQAVFQK
jgi:predicted amidohydrolase YtcJ